MESYSTSIVKQFNYYKSLGDNTFKLLSFEALQNDLLDHWNKGWQCVFYTISTLETKKI